MRITAEGEKMMVEKVILGKALLALIIRRNFNKKGVNFITPKPMPLQLGVSRYNKDTEILPHVHKSPPKFVNSTGEVLYIIKGKIKVDLFFKNKKVITKILKTGDIIMLNSGHALKILSDTKLFEVKQGPYISKEADKRQIRIK